MTRFARLLSGLLLGLSVAACGGGGGSAGATPGGGGTTPSQAASIEILASTTQLSSAAGSSATFTVVVKDANNQALPSETVTFSASSGSLSGALPAPKTGVAGEAITTVSLSPGSDASNRNIVVTARAGQVGQSITIAVQGSSLTLAGDSAVLSGGNTTFTAKALDSTGRGVAGINLVVTSALGNAVNPKTVVTDGQGAATFTYTGTSAGLDTLTVSGLGTSAKTAVSVSGDDFRFESPNANASLPVGATSTVTVRYVSGGAPVAGRVVTFSSTRGSISPDTGVTDLNGRASSVLTSSTSGPGVVIAQVASAQATQLVSFVATVPATLVLQANPGAVLPNAAGSSANQSALQAVVRDASGNPVSGVVVNFTAITDGSNGTIVPGSGVTDSNGTVVAQFIPGPLTTAEKGVQIRASVQGTSILGLASLTVSGQALFISIGSNNEISNSDAVTYSKEFSVYVTDANGAPAANRVVNLSVLPESYGKGTLEFKTGDTSWSYRAFVACPNEDINRNGILDFNEDGNGNGRLEPGLPVVVTPAAVTTASNGFAKFSLQYGENYANWVDTIITARAIVGGTESVQTARYALAASVPDMTSETAPPASVRSPFGVAADCSNPN